MTGRWVVRRGRVFWWAEEPDCLNAHPFPTWPEAFAYADLAARGATT